MTVPYLGNLSLPQQAPPIPTGLRPLPKYDYGMSDDEIELHKRNAIQMAQQGKSLAEVKAYMDAAGVPQKQKVDYSPGLTKDYMLGAVTSALHGATYGWDDEGVGSLYGLVTGAGAQAGRDIYRQRLQAFHDANPGTDLGLQLAGGIASSGAVGGMIKGAAGLVAPKAVEWLASLPGAVKAIGSAGLGGAAYGAGDVQGGAQQRLAAVPAAAATGATIGGALTGVAVAAGSTLKPILRAIPGVSKMFRSAGEMADDIIGKDLVADKAQLPDLIQKAKSAALNGQPVTLPDLAGEVTVGRMAAAHAGAGASKNLIGQGLEQRQMGAGDRLMDWLSGKSKLGLGNVEATRNGLLGARALQAETLYDDAYQQSAPMTDQLKSLMRDEPFRKAWNEARVLLREAKQIDVGPLSTPAPKAPFYPPKAPGSAIPDDAFPTSLSVAGLDYTKRYLDRIVRSGFGSENGWDRGRAYYINDRLKGALKEIDDLVPQYGTARKTYRGDSEVIDALDMGRGGGPNGHTPFLNKTADKIAVEMGGLSSQAEQEAYKLGAIESVRNAIYNKHAKAPDIARTVFGGKEMERRLTTLFGPDAPDLMNRLKTEARFAEVFRGTHGSRTAPLLNMMGETETQAAGVVGNLLAGRPGSALVAAARAGGARLKIGHGEEVADALAQRYTYGLNDPAELLGYLLNLQSRAPRPSGVPRFAAALGGQTVAGQSY